MESTQPQGGLELASDFRQSSSVHSSKKVFVCSNLRDKTEENKNTHTKKSYGHEFESFSTLSSSELSLAPKNYIIYLK